MKQFTGQNIKYSGKICFSTHLSRQCFMRHPKKELLALCSLFPLVVKARDSQGRDEEATGWDKEEIIMEPVTKDSLINAVLMIYEMGELSVETFLQEVKQIATDERVDWKKN